MKDLKAVAPKLVTKLKPVWRYRAVVFVLFVAALCGFLVIRINAANTVTASAGAVTPSKAVPHIDTKAVQQLQQLQDNSVSVKALFNQTRDNPFQ